MTVEATSSAARAESRFPPVPLVLIGIVSVQLGSAVAKGLFAHVGPGGAACLRVVFAALVLLLLVRPRVRGTERGAMGLAILFGLVTAGMNLAFYEALNRVPLGIAVTLEFVGPLGVAIVGSRRALDGLWVIMAGAGILLLAPVGGISLDPLGVLFALTAGTCWAAYIYLSARVGQTFAGGLGLALAMTAGGLALVPVGIASAGRHLLQPGAVLAGFGLALLSSVIPYSCELEALRSLPTRIFGVLMSLEPAVAALIGFVVLGQVLGPRAVAAIVLVSVASVGASRSGEPAIVD